MGWRASALAELFAGQPAALLGLEVADSAERDQLLDWGVFSLGPFPAPGEELLLPTPQGPRWCQIVPGDKCYSSHSADSNEGAYHAYPHPSQHSHSSHSSHRLKPGLLTFQARELQLLELDRLGLYRLLAQEIGCRPGIEAVVPGIWVLGTAPVPGGGKARVYLVERGVGPEAVESALHRCAFKTVCLLRVAQANPGILGAFTGKIIIEGFVEESALSGKFTAPALEDLEAIEPGQKRGAWIDRESTPPLLVVGTEKFKLGMYGRKPALGVLLLEYLLDHPQEPIACWELERKVCASKEALQTNAGSVAEILDPKAERDLAQALQEKTAELAELESDLTAPEYERESVREELEQLRQHYLATHRGFGLKRLLGNTDSQRARHRVRKALDFQVEVVRGQSPQVGKALEAALGKGNTVQFLPPPEWGL